MIHYRKLFNEVGPLGRIASLVGIMALLCSCAHREGPRFLNGSGDAGRFIVEQAVLRGAEPITSRGLPAVSSSWTYATDDSGVIVRMSKADYPVVEALLLRAFGTPKLGPVDSADGRRIGAYQLTPKGAALQFARDTRWTQVIVVREPNEREIAADFLRSLR